jgi:hypothetical protein
VLLLCCCLKRHIVFIRAVTCRQGSFSKRHMHEWYDKTAACLHCDDLQLHLVKSVLKQQLKIVLPARGGRPHIAGRVIPTSKNFVCSVHQLQTN